MRADGAIGGQQKCTFGYVKTSFICEFVGFLSHLQDFFFSVIAVIFPRHRWHWVYHSVS